MAERAGQSWIGGWTAEEPVQIGFTAVAREDGEWRSGALDHLEYRDLGLEQASDGKVGASHVRARGAAGAEPIAFDHDFRFLYVLAGSIAFEDESGSLAELEKGSSAFVPGLLRLRETPSASFEAVEIVSPAGAPAIGGSSPLPARAASLEAGRRPVYCHDREEVYEVGAGPRTFFKYRDLGTRGPSGERVHIHDVRAAMQADGGTGWHYHSMAQWFMVIGGEADIRVEAMPRRTMRYLDTMCIGSGSRMRHNVGPFSDDYAVLEMCVPAAYETIAVDAPEGAAE